MTNNASGQPTDPRGGSGTQQTQRGVYNPITTDNMQNHQQPSWFKNLETPHLKLLVGVLFALLFGAACMRPEFSPLTVIILTGCLMYRLQPWQRNLAGVPLLFAAFRFFLTSPALYENLALRIDPFTRRQDYTPGGEFGVSWIPAFLSACLFFMPRRESVTLKIVVVESFAVILSSLLPGQGFLTILAILNYTLFFTVIVGLFLDLKPSAREIFSNAATNS